MTTYQTSCIGRGPYSMNVEMDSCEGTNMYPSFWAEQVSWRANKHLLYSSNESRHASDTYHLLFCVFFPSGQRIQYKVRDGLQVLTSGSTSLRHWDVDHDDKVSTKKFRRFWSGHVELTCVTHHWHWLCALVKTVLFYTCVVLFHRDSLEFEDRCMNTNLLTLFTYLKFIN